MEEENKVTKKIEQYQGDIKKAKTPFWVYIIIIIGVLVSLRTTSILHPTPYVDDYIFLALGGLVGVFIGAIIIGFIPIRMLEKRFYKARPIIFSISFLLISIISLLGRIYLNSK